MSNQKAYKACWTSYNSTKGSLSFFIDGDVGGYDYTGINLTEVMMEIEYYQPNSIKFVMFSYGGAAIVGLAIHDYIKQLPIASKARIFGIAGSASTAIACGCDEVDIAPNAFYFVHNAYIEGNHHDEENEGLKEVNERYISIYMKKTGRDRDWVVSAMNEGTNNDKLIPASLAVEYGFADTVMQEEMRIAAKAAFFNTKLNVMNQNVLLEKILGLFGIKKDGSEEDILGEIKAKIDPEGQIAAQVQPLNERLDAMKAKLESEFAPMQNDIAAIRSDIDTKINAMKASIEAKVNQDTMNDFKENIQSLKSQIAELQGKMEAVPTDLEEKAQTQAQRINDQESKIKALSTQLAGIKANRSGGVSISTPPVPTEERDNGSTTVAAGFLSKYLNGTITKN